MKEKMPKIIETHAHYDDEQFDIDREKLIPLLHDSGIAVMVNISYNKKSIENSIKLAKTYDYVYAAVGYHPCDCMDMTENSIDELERYASFERVVAIGEIGLDYYWKDIEKEVQKSCFIKQLELANKLKLPVVIHSREAAKDTMDIMKNYGGGSGVIHCFSYGVDMAKAYVDMGYYIGIGGVLTFKNAKHIKEVVAEISLDNIVLETDSPYLSPEPFRGKRNTSANLIYVAQKIAEIKGMNVDEVIDITYNNARKLYGI